jgi:hypothetical protein
MPSCPSSVVLKKTHSSTQGHELSFVPCMYRHSSRSSVRGKQAKQLAALSSKSMANLMDKYAAAVN